MVLGVKSCPTPLALHRLWPSAHPLIVRGEEPADLAICHEMTVQFLFFHYLVPFIWYFSLWNCAVGIPRRVSQYLEAEVRTTSVVPLLFFILVSHLLILKRTHANCLAQLFFFYIMPLTQCCRLVGVSLSDPPKPPPPPPWDPVQPSPCHPTSSC